MRSRSRVGGLSASVVAWATSLLLACGGGGDGGVQLNDVAFGGGTFVAVGETSSAFANPGPGWTPFGTGVGSLNAVTHLPERSLFVAVGDGGAIVTSADGTGWTQQLSPSPVDLHDVAAGFGWLVAVGDGGTILRSADGVTWTQQPSGTSAPLYGVAAGEDRFVAVGAGGVVAISADFGATWRETFTGQPNDLYSVAFGEVFEPGSNARVPRWVACGAGGAIQYSAAPGDDPWQVAASAVLPDLNDVIFTQDVFVVVGIEGTALVSSNGRDYTQTVTDSGQYLFGVAFGNGLFIAVASGEHVFTSRDAVIWQEGKV